jgi:hypothetical protein
MLVACLYVPATWPNHLGEGDVTGRVVGMGGDTLRGAVVRVRQTPLKRVSDAAGVFMVRGLPEGTHRLAVSFDGDGDGIADQAAEVVAKVRSQGGRRGSVDLGDIRLSASRVLTGTAVRAEDVSGCASSTTPPAGGVAVLVRGEPRALVDPVTGSFTVRGIPVGASELGLGAPGRTLSQLVVLPPSGNVTLDRPLCLLPSVGVATLSAQVEPTVGAPVLPSPIRARAVSVDGQATAWEAFTGNQVRLDLPPGLHTLEVELGEGWLTLREANVALAADGFDLGVLVAVPITVGGECTDMDDDGVCFFGDGDSATCDAECRRPGRALDEPCLDSERQLDCDDDADGQPDPEERLGTLSGGAPCRCDAAGPLPSGDTCDRDPSRYDLDHDGICDIYQAPSSCTDPSGCGSSSSSGPPPSSGGSSSGPPPSSSGGGEVSSSLGSASSGPLPSSSGGGEVSSSLGSASSGPLPSSSGGASSGPLPSSSGGSSSGGQDVAYVYVPQFDFQGVVSVLTWDRTARTLTPASQGDITAFPWPAAAAVHPTEPVVAVASWGDISGESSMGGVKVMRRTANGFTEMNGMNFGTAASVAFSADGSSLYMGFRSTSLGTGRVVRFVHEAVGDYYRHESSTPDSAPSLVLGEPSSMAWHPDRLVVTDPQNRKVVTLTPDSLELLSPVFNVEEGFPVRILRSPSTGLFFLTTQMPDEIAVCDFPAGMRILGQWAVQGGPIGMAMDAATSRVYVASRDSNQIRGFFHDIASPYLTSLPGSPYGGRTTTEALAVDGPSRVLFATNFNGETGGVDVFMLEEDGSLTFHAHAPTPGEPLDVAVGP